MATEQRPKVLGSGSPKGGVGKTQTAVTLAHLASLAGHKVLLVDADENLSAYDWVMRAGDRMDLDIATEDDAAQLVRLHELREYDLIVVDLPGARSSSGWSALLGEHGPHGVIVDALVIPSKVSTMDLRPAIRVIRDVVGPAAVPYLLVGTMVKAASMERARRDLDDLASDGIHVARTILRDLIAHPEAVTESRPITDMPGGRHSTTRAAEREYRMLAREVFAGLLQMPWPEPTDLELPPQPIGES
jgi:chromosome partitioning protein